MQAKKEFPPSDLAHTVDEYVELTQLFGGVECYYAVMEALLL